MTQLTCARCAKPMARVTASLPQGQAVCRPCRRIKSAPHPKNTTHACKECGRPCRTSVTYCTDKCRYRHRDKGRTWDYKKALTCATCEKSIWKAPTSRPQGEAQCRDCRSAHLATRRGGGVANTRQTPCVDCGSPSYGERCRPCRDAVVQRESDPIAALRRKRQHNRRERRDKAAPGLSKAQRHKLLHLWRKQGRACAYCLSSQAQCVDHVIPLALGGTNYEGNLAPACSDCNLRKSDSLLIEWRHKRRTQRQRVEPPPREKPYRPRVVKPKVWSAPSLTICPQCGALHTGKRYCSSECSTEWWRVELRNRYRIKVGIPLDAPHYSRAA